MKQNGLSLSEKRRARKSLALFEGTNAASFILVGGQVMILYALSLGADNFFIGLISSFQYISFLFMLIGRAVVGRFGLRKMMRLFWGLRYLCVVPVVLTPLLLPFGKASVALLILAISMLSFNIARGIAIIGFNPILGMINEPRNMGSYLSRLQIIYHSSTLICGLFVAFALGSGASPWRYALFISLGIVLGLYASTLINRLPDPELDSGGGDFLQGVREAFSRPDFRRFIAHFTLLSVVSGMAVPFVVVFARDVYLQNDRNLMLYTVVGGIGAVSMGAVSRLLMDRLGPKPFYILFTMLFALAMIPLVLSPQLSGVPLVLLIAAVFFLHQFGYMGGQVSSKNYLFSITAEREHLNLGIVYQLMFGLGNALGAFAGGALLSGLSTSGLSSGEAYRAYFSIILLLFLVMMLTALFIRDVGRYSVGSALSIIFSPRDLRAMVLLDKLDRSGSTHREMEVLHDIAGVGSSVAADDVLERLKSPRFYVRARALRALEHAPADPRISEALIREVKKRTYTTAYIAARMMGRKGMAEGEPALRNALKSRDYLLKANALIALARIGGDDKQCLIEQTVSTSKNPMVIMHGAVALQILGRLSSLPVMANLLKLKDPPSFLRDEVILSMAALLGMERWFYPLYSVFQKQRRDGIAELTDRLVSSLKEAQRREFPDLEQACSMVLKRPERFSETIIPVFSRLPLPEGLDAQSLEAIARDSDLLRFERLRFFLAAVAVRTLISPLRRPGQRGWKKPIRRMRRQDDPIDL